jgi:hypothetical protein
MDNTIILKKNTIRYGYITQYISQIYNRRRIPVKSKKSKLYMLFTVLVITLSLITNVSAPPNPSASLEQLKNGKASSPDHPGSWVKGTLIPQLSHYYEGQSVPYRVIMKDLPVNTLVTIRIGFDITKNGKHAIDYLTSYNYTGNPSHEDVYGHTFGTIDPLDGLSGVSATERTWPIPAPSSAGSPVTGQPITSFNAIAEPDRVMTLFGGTISAIVYHDQGDLTEDTDEAQMDITFTPVSSTAVLAWGGHIASVEDWGYDGDEPRSASAISGNPYHTSLVSWTLDGLGQQDLPLQVDPPCQIIVKKVIDWGYYTQYVQGWDFTFDPSWGISFTLGHMESESFYLTPDTYSVTETDMDGWKLYKVTIEGGGYDDEISGPTAEVELEAFDVITITFYNRPPDFVIPENPLGTLGSIVAMLGVAALVGVFRKGKINISID